VLVLLLLSCSSVGAAVSWAVLTRTRAEALDTLLQAGGCWTASCMPRGRVGISPVHVTRIRGALEGWLAANGDQGMEL
jgi:hypothetical protein